MLIVPFSNNLVEVINNTMHKMLKLIIYIYCIYTIIFRYCLNNILV